LRRLLVFVVDVELMSMRDPVRASRTVRTFFVAALGVSYLSGGLLIVLRLIRGETISPTDALMLFPVLIFSVAVLGVLLTQVAGGPAAVRALFGEMRVRRSQFGWFPVLLVFPAVIIAVLSLLSRISPVFAPNMFLLGVAFGVPPGFLEEIGWTGLALRELASRGDPLRVGLRVGVVWSLWHLPVVNSLGAAVPHGAFFLPFFLSFAAVLIAVRVLIAWVYFHTRSLLLAQLLHASSTASLVVFGPVGTSPAQEALWYGVYGAVLWILVGFATTFGPRAFRDRTP
jgi:membrane protease YdiL (CAAX protease family)